MSNSAFTASGGGGGISISTTAPIQGGPISGSGTISLANSGVAAGTYQASQITIDAHGLISSATSSLSVAGQNLAFNPNLQLWQRGSSFTASSNTQRGYTADRWQFGLDTNAYTYTVSKENDTNPGAYFMRVNRTAGAALGAGGVEIGQTLPISSCLGLAGNYVTFSLDIRLGSDYDGGSGAKLGVIVTSGTGSTNVSDIFSGFTGRQVVINGQNGTTSWVRYSFTSPLVLDANVTQIFLCLKSTPTQGSGSANDYFDIRNLKFEIGQIATPMLNYSLTSNLVDCMAFYQKSFPLNSTPASNFGTDTGEYTFPAVQAGASVERWSIMPFRPYMMAVPTVTLYNPGDVGSEGRNITRAQNCTGTSVTANSINGFEVSCTGTAGTFVSDDLGIHWTAEAEIF